MAAVDPITLAVVRNYLTASAVEMRDTIQRTSFSPVIYEDRDFACGLLDASGGTLAEAPGLTAFMGTLSPGVRKCLEVVGFDALEPGDVFIVDMPAFTGSHPADMMLFMPIFHSGRLFGFTASKAHLIDVGAKDPYPTDSTDCFQEGLRLPPIKLYRRGVLDTNIEGIIKVNSRAPEVIWGDLQAEISCFRVGERACLGLLDKYGFDTVTACIEEIYIHSERLARAAIREMPAGTWSGEEFCDSNGLDPDVPVKVAIDITIDPVNAEVIFDTSRSDPQQRGPMNTPLISTISMARMMGKLLTAPFTTANEGSFRPIKLIAPEGSVFNPSPTAPTNLYGWPVLSGIECIVNTLAPHFPDRFPAQSGGDLCGCGRYGFWPETGKMWFEANIEGIGMGASAWADGESALVHIDEACSRNLPVEMEESKNPTIIERYELIQDSGGPGQFRGGLGVRRDYRVLLDGRSISVLERCNSPAKGVLGGGAATPTIGYQESSIHGTGFFKKTPDRAIAAGDLLSVRTGGGGGWGDPRSRDPEAVLLDVLDEYVSVEAAEREYGVVVDRARGEVVGLRR